MTESSPHVGNDDTVVMAREPSKALVVRRSAELLVWKPPLFPLQTGTTVQSYVADAEMEEPTAVAVRRRPSYLDGEVVPEVAAGSWTPGERKRLRRGIVGASTAAAAALVAAVAFLPSHDEPAPAGGAGVAIVEASPGAANAASGAPDANGAPPPLIAPSGANAAAPGTGTVPPLAAGNGAAGGAAGTPGAAGSGAAGAPGAGSTGSTGAGSTGSGTTGSGSTGSGTTGSGSTGSGSTGSGSTGSGSRGSGTTTIPVVSSIGLPTSLALGNSATLTATSSPGGAAVRWVQNSGTPVRFSPDNRRPSVVVTPVAPSAGDTAPVANGPASISAFATLGRVSAPFTVSIPIVTNDTVAVLSSSTTTSVRGISNPTNAAAATARTVNVYELVRSRRGTAYRKLGTAIVGPDGTWSLPVPAESNRTVVAQSTGGGTVAVTIP